MDLDFEWDLMNFDKLKIYKIYFPKNNITYILSNINNNKNDFDISECDSYNNITKKNELISKEKSNL